MERSRPGQFGFARWIFECIATARSKARLADIILVPLWEVESSIWVAADSGRLTMYSAKVQDSAVKALRGFIGVPLQQELDPPHPHLSVHCVVS